ncbi:hypothetical protein [Modestobacter versicolor]|uniref:hypothetical protein n=1 Tax=Modestobacter versicolor TaxID=429133 RepID=UPI0034DDED6B
MVSRPAEVAGPPDTAPAEAGREDHPRPGGRRARLRAPLGWAALLAVLVGIDVALLWNRFYYANDDLLQFAVARDEGLSWTTLSLNVFQHFGPYDRTAHLLVYRLFDLSPLAGLAFMTVNLTALLAAALWLMTELRLSTARRVVALVLIAPSVGIVESAVWFDAAMHVLPAIAMTLAICAAHVRGVRLGATRWHVVTVVLFLLGQLVQERPVFALPLLVLVDVLLLWRDRPWADRFRALRQLWKPLLALTVAAAAVAAALRAFVVVEAYPAPDWATTGRAVLSSFSNYVVPSLVNLPLQRPTGTATELVVVAAVLIVGVVVALSRRGNAGPLLFAAATFAMYYGFLKFSPILNADTVTANAERLTNSVYVTVPAVIALVHLRAPVRLVDRVLGRVPPGLHAARVVRGLQVAGCLALALLMALTANAYLDRRWSETTEARAWLDAVRAGQDEWTDPDVTLVPLTAPAAMATAWSRPFGRQDQLLSLVSRGFTSGDLDGPTVLIDDEGRVRPAALETVGGPLTVLGGDCDDDGAVRDLDLALRAPARGAPLFLQLRYEADLDMDTQLSAGTTLRGWQANHFVTKLRAGEHTELMPIDAATVGRVDLRVLSPGGSFCVQEASLVRPVLVESPGQCRTVDRYGRPGGPQSCPP